MENSGLEELKSFWRRDETDFIADIGVMKEAIVVRYYPLRDDGLFYSISLKSYFPFTEEQRALRFKTPVECCAFSESVILDWLKSIFTSPLSLMATHKLVRDSNEKCFKSE